MHLRLTACLLLLGLFLLPWGCTVTAETEADDDYAQGGSGGEGTGGSYPTYPISEPVGPWNLCAETDIPPEATVVTAHEQADQYWMGWEDGENLRIVDAPAAFPEAGPWRRVFLQVLLECPADGRCDWWDRGATISLVEGEGDDEVAIELARHMTPYRRGMCFVADVTDLASRLRGTQTIRSFIDTWVGPGHSNGSGWRVTTRFIMHPGLPEVAIPDEVIPLWNPNAEDRLVNVGEPEEPIREQLAPQEVTIPADAVGARLLFHVTGHGQGNQGNCAEFCDMTHRVSFGDGSVEFVPWRDDCQSNPIDDQQGTWTFDRAGWCPGAVVQPVGLDITDQVQPGQTLTFDYAILDDQGQTYVNSCRPGAGDTDNVCTGCVSSGMDNCDFNNNGHTAPYHRIGVQLLIYR